MACMNRAYILRLAIVVSKSSNTYSLGEAKSLFNRRLLLLELMIFQTADLN